MNVKYKDYSFITYNDSYKKDWDAFIDNSTNGTIFHKQAFLKYHPKTRFSFHHVMVYKKDRLVSVIPGAVEGQTFRSPTGASFGGFVVSKTTGIEDADNIIKGFIKYCSQSGIKEIYLTPPMQVYYNTFNEAVEYAMHYNHFIQISSLYSSVIDFSIIQGRENLDRKVRYNINKALRSGIIVEQKNDFDVFYPILLQNKSKFEAKPTHTLSEIKKINTLLPGSTILFIAYYKEKPIAGQLLFVANKNCVLNFYTMHLYEYHYLNSVSLLVETAIRWCFKNNFKYLDYGVSADTFSPDPMEPSWSLIQFKESMGANGCQRKTYYRRIF